MKVFVTWSGKLSHDIAAAVRRIFPFVLQQLEVFMSEVDIESGVPWFATIAGNLAESNYGLIIVTRENQHRPWVMFEAGALAKGISKSRVTPLLVDITNTDVVGPLSQFQTNTLSRGDLHKVLKELNESREDQKLSETQLDETFNKWWPDLEVAIRDALAAAAARDSMQAPPVRTTPELLEDALLGIRKLSLQTDAIAAQAAIIPQIATMMQLSNLSNLGLVGARVNTPGATGPTGSGLFGHLDAYLKGFQGGLTVDHVSPPPTTPTQTAPPPTPTPSTPPATPTPPAPPVTPTPPTPPATSTPRIRRGGG